MDEAWAWACSRDDRGILACRENRRRRLHRSCRRSSSRVEGSKGSRRRRQRQMEDGWGRAGGLP